MRPTTCKSGWPQERGRFTDLCIDTLERHAPGLRGSIVAAELLTPLDIEQEFRISGGHWHHGELAFDQFFMVRPVPGAAQHRTPAAGPVPVRRRLPSRRRRHGHSRTQCRAAGSQGGSLT